MVAHVVWTINFKSEVRSDLRGCLKAIAGSKTSFFVSYHSYLQADYIFAKFVNIDAVAREGKSDRKIPVALLHQIHVSSPVPV